MQKPDPDKNLFEERSRVTDDERRTLLRQRGCVVWFTGLSGAGKSTLAKALERKLFELGHPAFILDGDNMRRGLNRDLSFSHEDRTENIRRVAEVAKLFADAGMICIAAFISPFRKDREDARRIIGMERMLEVYLSTPIEVCERRDTKGLYKKAREGEVRDFTGISSPYEPPAQPDLEVDTVGCTVDEAVARIIDTFISRECLFPDAIRTETPPPARDRISSPR